MSADDMLLLMFPPDVRNAADRGRAVAEHINRALPILPAWAKLKPADLARIVELEACNASRGDVHVWAPRGECSSCDAGRGVMWPDEFVDGKRQPLASCAGCRALWPKLREVENLVMGWAAHQQAVAAAGGWTPDMLREHSKALHPEEVRRT